MSVNLTHIKPMPILAIARMEASCHISKQSEYKVIIVLVTTLYSVDTVGNNTGCLLIILINRLVYIIISFIMTMTNDNVIQSFDAHALLRRWKHLFTRALRQFTIRLSWYGNRCSRGWHAHDHRVKVEISRQAPPTKRSSLGKTAPVRKQPSIDDRFTRCAWAVSHGQDQADFTWF